VSRVAVFVVEKMDMLASSVDSALAAYLLVPRIFSSSFMKLFLPDTLENTVLQFFLYTIFLRTCLTTRGSDCELSVYKVYWVFRSQFVCITFRLRSSAHIRL
jgi:hypothetical protein